MKTSTSPFADSKPHYAILDGLRGVAALVVIWYHVFEGFATSPLDQHFNHGYLAVGWSLADWNLPGSFLRLMFAFSMGLLMSRNFRPWKVRGAFWICSAAIVLLLSMPRLGGEDAMWLNGLYEAVCTILIFPLLVYMGASGHISDGFPKRLCKFLGDIAWVTLKVYDEPLRRWLSRKLL